MRDKDAHLIFESYRKKVILNEVAQALAIPAVQGLGAAMSWIAGTAVGAVILDQLSKGYQTLATGLAKKKADANIEKIKSLFQSDSSLRSQYEILNYIKDNSKNANILKLESSQRGILDFYSSVQNNVEYTDENLKYLVESAIKQSEQMESFVKVKISTSTEAEIEGITNLPKKNQAEIIKGLNDLLAGKTSGGGGEPPDNKDKKDKNNKDKKSLFDRFNELNMKNVLYLLAIAVGSAGVALLLIAPEAVGSTLAQTAIGTATGAVEGGAEAVKRAINPPTANAKQHETPANMTDIEAL